MAAAKNGVFCHMLTMAV
jgi:hypothetical protein